MDYPKPSVKTNGLIPSDNNPFKGDIERFRKAMKDRNRSHNAIGYKQTRITVIEETSYFPGGFAKLYQNKELLDDLSPEACKLLIHIALNMDWEEELFQIKYQDIYMDRRKTAKATLELLGKRILCYHKKTWYWVNVTLLIVGNIHKHKDND